MVGKKKKGTLVSKESSVEKKSEKDGQAKKRKRGVRKCLRNLSFESEVEKQESVEEKKDEKKGAESQKEKSVGEFEKEKGVETEKEKNPNRRK